VSAGLLMQLLWQPLPDALPAFGWWPSPQREPAGALAMKIAVEPAQPQAGRRARRDAVQTLVRKAYLVTVAEQHSEHRPPASFAQARRAHLTGLLAQASAESPARTSMTISGSDLDLAWRLYELAHRARLNAIKGARPTPSEGVQRGKQVPTFKFSIVSGGESLGDVTYGICRPCSAGMLYQIEFAPDWQFRGFGHLALGQLESRHPDLTWYTTGQLPHARGFYDRHRQGSDSPWTEQQNPCPHFD
jgi:hypothetical protein